MTMIKIIDQGMFPDKLPPVDVEFVNFWDGDGWELCATGRLENKDKWIVLSAPEKPLEDYTEAELIEKWTEINGNGRISLQPGYETLSDVLIKMLK